MWVYVLGLPWSGVGDVISYVRVVINLVTNRIDKRLAFVHKCSLNDAAQLATALALVASLV